MDDNHWTLQSCAWHAEYVMKELTLKLDWSLILKNAADLVDSYYMVECFKDAKKMGFTNLHHHKVRASHDYSFLL